MRDPVRVAVVALLLAACSGDDAPCEDFTEVTARIAEPPPPALESQVRACQGNLKQCLPLCEQALADAGVTAVLESCTVTHDPTGHGVTAGYTAACSE